MVFMKENLGFPRSFSNIFSSNSLPFFATNPAAFSIITKKLKKNQKAEQCRLLRISVGGIMNLAFMAKTGVMVLMPKEKSSLKVTTDLTFFSSLILHFSVIEG